MISMSIMPRLWLLSTVPKGCQKSVLRTSCGGSFSSCTEIDRSDHEWAPGADSDPESAAFAYSVAGKAFFS